MNNKLNSPMQWITIAISLLSFVISTSILFIIYSDKSKSYLNKEISVVESTIAFSSNVIDFYDMFRPLATNDIINDIVDGNQKHKKEIIEFIDLMDGWVTTYRGQKNTDTKIINALKKEYSNKIKETKGLGTVLGFLNVALLQKKETGRGTIKIKNNSNIDFKSVQINVVILNSKNEILDSQYFFIDNMTPNSIILKTFIFDNELEDVNRIQTQSILAKEYLFL